MHLKPAHEIERAVRGRFEFALAQSTIAEEVCKVARELAIPSRKTGRYMESIGPALRGSTWVARAGVDYSAALEGGTGLYGRKHKMVTAAGGKKFRAVIDGEVVEFRKQRGTKPKHIMQHAAEIVALRSPGLSYRGHRWRPVAD